MLLFAVFIVSMAFAVPASAEEEQAAEWLVNGNKIELGMNIGTDALAELLLEDREFPLVGAAAVLCIIELLGTGKELGEGNITTLLNLKGESINEQLPFLGKGVGSECMAVPLTGCEEGTAAAPIEVWPVGLPWDTLLIKSGAKWFDLLSINKTMGFKILCYGNKFSGTDQCTYPNNDGNVEIINDANGAAAFSSSAFAPLATCTASNKKSGVFQLDAPATIKLGNGELLTFL